MTSSINQNDIDHNSRSRDTGVRIFDFVQTDQMLDGDSLVLRAQDKPTGAVHVDPEIFLTRVENRLFNAPRRGTLAYIEIMEHGHGTPAEALSADGGAINVPDISACIAEVLGADGIFCWYGGRFIVLINRPATLIARQMLSRVSHAIATRQQPTNPSTPGFTPAVGYADFRMASSIRELWLMADSALDRAKSSLEIEPFRYVESEKKPLLRIRIPESVKIWRRMPTSIVLAFQLVASLALGLGAPFMLYAVCDALGFDISGPVYIGVVAVLVVTAAMIWIEGFLALKHTDPPAQPGSPWPLATVIIPAYLPNEADTIMETLQAFLKLDYANTVQVIVTYNCPAPHMPVEDEMAALAARVKDQGRFLIEPVRVHGSTSKAQNVNAVIGRVRGRFVGIYDADHHPRPDSLQRAWRWLSNGWDIVQGRCSVRNGGDTWVSRMVAVEFEQIYAVSHPGRARFHGFGIFGGSNGFWRTSVLHETRMRRSMLTEDIDSSIRAVTAGYRIAGDRDLISEELAPTSIKQLLNQRLRWAQGWFQVSLRRIFPALISSKVTFRQKVGLCHLLIWRELFPWYSIQVMPIMAYWVWVYGWGHIHWAIPIFLATTIFTASTGPGQVLLTYVLAQDSLKKKPGWFIEYVFVSIFFFSFFKDALSRIAHVKEAMHERAWKVTPRTAPGPGPNGPAGVSVKCAVTAPTATVLTATVRAAGALLALFLLVLPGSGWAQSASPTARPSQRRSPGQIIATLLGGEAATIQAARVAALQGRHAEAARLFETAISNVPRRRAELLPEYAETLYFSRNYAGVVPLYQEVLANSLDRNTRRQLSLRLAAALTAVRRYHAALATYNDLLASFPHDPEVVLPRSRVLSLLGETQAAMSALDQIPAAQWATGPLAAVGGDVLIEAAVRAAKAGEAATALHLYDQAFLHNPKLRDAHQHDYQALATGVGSAKLAIAWTPLSRIALLRRQLSRSVAGSPAYLNWQSQLAQNLTAANKPAAALVAWNAYVRYSPGNTDAMVARARLLARLGDHDKALGLFKMAYSQNRNDGAVRDGLVGETVTLARAAARQNRNADAQKLFASAIALGVGHDSELLREYADQLSFSGRSADAIPFLLEALKDPAMLPLNRQRALIGLADAYSWSDRLSDALAIYTNLTNAAPVDVGLRWSQLVCAARIAARTDNNAAAVDLFAQAVTLAPERKSAILVEYADQLSFAGRSPEAIPLYQAALMQPDLSENAVLAVRSGLAQAYAWAGNYVDAQALYSDLVGQYPQRIDLKWKLLVMAARDAAVHDRNRQSEILFANAIKLSPDSSKGILREYADQLSFTGQSSAAIMFYKAANRQPGLSSLDRIAINRAQARALDWSGDYVAATTAYDELIKSDPADLSLRRQWLIEQAREAARTNHNKQSVTFFAEAIRIQPERRQDILKEYADQLTFSHQAAQAIPLYYELLRNTLSPAIRVQYQLGLAQALAWNNQLKEALAAYQQVAASYPNELAARAGVARTLSWMGHQTRAAAEYGKILQIAPNDGEALRGLAQAEDWDGRHFTAQALLRRRLEKDPNDLVARHLLAQSLIWSGRPDVAAAEVKLAMRDASQTGRTQAPQILAEYVFQTAGKSIFLMK